MINSMDEKIKTIIAEILSVDIEEITDDTVIGDLPEWDSLHQLHILDELEHFFSIKFTQEELAELEDVSDLISLVRDLQKTN